MDTEPQLDGDSVSNDLDDFDEVVEVEHESLPSDRYFDREISWLRFNQRVL